MKTFVLTLCVFYHLLPFVILVSDDDIVDADGDDEQKSAKDPMKNKVYQAEIQRGDEADLLSNIHQAVPHNFQDFGRRFMIEYPETEKHSSRIDDEAEDNLDRIIKQALKEVEGDNQEEDALRPVQAPPEVVLAVAKQAAIFEKTNPSSQRDEALEDHMLRNGDYWNDVWIEDVPDPIHSHLRTGKSLESVRVKIMPGSKLYKLVSMTRDLSPKLLYVINGKADK